MRSQLGSKTIANSLHTFLGLTVHAQKHDVQVVLVVVPSCTVKPDRTRTLLQQCHAKCHVVNTGNLKKEKIGARCQLEALH